MPHAPTGLLLIAHGSRQPEANADAHALADRLAHHPGYACAVAAFLELAEPSIPEGGKRCVELGARRVVLAPYFLSSGVHVRRDLAEHRAALAAAYPEVEFLLAEPLGPHPLLDQILLERAGEALLRTP